MASPNPRKEALVTPSPPRFTSTTSPDQTLEPPMSSTATTDMQIIITGIQSQSSFSKTTPSDSESTESESSESDFYVPDNTEEFWAHDLHQAQKKITYVQATVDTNARISTYNLLVSGLEQNEIQQLLQKKHSGSRATFTDEQVIFQIMPGNAHAQLIVFLQQNFVRAMEAANYPMARSTWVGIGATSSKGRFCGKEPDWGVRPTIGSALGATDLPRVEELWPSLVVEVGSSQGYLSSKRDARWWWNNSDGATKLVLLFKINNTRGFMVEVELWEEVVTRNTGVATGSRPPISTNLQLTQSTTVDTSGQHSGIYLRYSTLMRQPPVPIHPEFVVLTSEMLTNICAPAV